jgi:hypothetical protein
MLDHYNYNINIYIILEKLQILFKNVLMFISQINCIFIFRSQKYDYI